MAVVPLSSLDAPEHVRLRNRVDLIEYDQDVIQEGSYLDPGRINWGRISSHVPSLSTETHLTQALQTRFDAVGRFAASISVHAPGQPVSGRAGTDQLHGYIVSL